MKTKLILLLFILFSQNLFAMSDEEILPNQSEIINAVFIYMGVHAKLDVNEECSAIAKNKLDQFYSEFTEKKHTDERLEDDNLWGIWYVTLARRYQINKCEIMANITYKRAEYFAEKHGDQDLFQVIRDMQAL
jgi:hypothetical protein